MESINSWGLNDEFTGLAKSGMDACKVFVEFNYLTTSDVIVCNKSYRKRHNIVI
jgi:hypothetical protein